MANPDVWPTIHRARNALAAVLESLTGAQWATTWPCEGADRARCPRPGDRYGEDLGVGVLREDDHVGVQCQKGAGQRHRWGTAPADTLARFKAEANSTKHPPGPIDSWWGEAIGHGEDIRRPLCITHEYPTDAAVRVADFYKGSNLIIGAEKRIAVCSCGPPTPTGRTAPVRKCRAPSCRS